MADPEPPTLDIDRHLKYWKMCLRSPLPGAYLSNEGNRMALAYFIINSITILTPPGSERTPLIPPEEKRQIREWILFHQHPGGGFSGTSSLVFPLHVYDEWDSEAGERSLEHAGLANIAATLFALQLLALLSDEDNAEDAFKGVDRPKLLRWLKRLQREDGSFGEVLRLLPGKGWFIAGGNDMRYCYVATAIRWMLRGDVKEGESGWVEDFDTESLAGYILKTQTYDGGFAGSSSEEPHAGYAYCAINALTLLDRPLENAPAHHPSATLHSHIRSMPGLLHWLASRQFIYLEPPPPPPGQDPDDDDEDYQVNFLLPTSLAPSDDSETYVGLNGRCNKCADTCYYWWVGGALASLGRGELIAREPARRFLLGKMQHRIGGFAKNPGNPPDVYHACFGLAILGVMGEEGLNRVDSALAVPVETVRRVERARRRLVEGDGGNGGEGKAGKLVGDAVGMGLGAAGGRPGWLVGVEGGA